MCNFSTALAQLEPCSEKNGSFLGCEWGRGTKNDFKTYVPHVKTENKKETNNMRLVERRGIVVSTFAYGAGVPRIISRRGHILLISSFLLESVD